MIEAVVLGDGGKNHTEIVRLLIAAGANTKLADRDGEDAADACPRTRLQGRWNAFWLQQIENVAEERGRFSEADR